MRERKINLSPIARDQLFRAFHEAFADYAVDMSGVTEEVKRVRAVKNNVDWDVSVGAFDGERMVGFTLIAVDRHRGALAAFDAATGIVPTARGRGLAVAMIEHALPALRARGVGRFLLEVIQSNEPAIRAYRKAGFEIERELGCYALDVTDPRGAASDGSLTIEPIDRDTVMTFGEDMDWEPSWENSLGAVSRIPDPLVTLGAFREGACVGAIVYAPLLGWIMTLAVRRPERRRGVGTALVRGLAERLPEMVGSVRLLNVDGADRGMRAFLARLGFRHILDQYEMSRAL